MRAAAIELSTHVRVPSRKPQFGNQEPPRTRQVDRVEHARRAGPGANGTVGGRRQRRGRQGFRGQGLGAGRRRDGPQVARPHAPTCEHRPSGTRQPDGPHRPFAAPQAGSDRAHALRPARLGQDDHLRQARQAAPTARPQADARGGRLATPRRYPAVADSGRATRHPRLCRPVRERPRGPLPDRRARGQGQRRGSGDPRYGRPLARR